MSYLQELHQAHKARLARMVPKPAAAQPSARFVQNSFRWKINLAAELKEINVSYEPTPGFDFSTILNQAHKFYAISKEAILSNRKNAREVRARQVIMYLARELTRGSYPKIAIRMGKDHSTILHGWNKINKQLATDSVLRGEIDHLKAEIRAARYYIRPNYKG